MLVAGNWKMHTDLAEAVRLASDIARVVGAIPAVPDPVRVALCPPFVSIEAVAEILGETVVGVGAQDMHEEEKGAFTGAISAPMLTSAGCEYVILGHSERREHFGETDEQVGKKVYAALRHGLVPIVCVGETLDQRDAEQAEAVVKRQLTAALDGVSIDDSDALVVAYEPVWAIGTGRTASPEQAQAMHAHIRRLLSERLGESGRSVAILYGGSVKPDNAAALFAEPDIDGGLIGGASLKAPDFGAIVEAAAASVGG